MAQKSVFFPVNDAKSLLADPLDFIKSLQREMFKCLTFVSMKYLSVNSNCITLSYKDRPLDLLSRKGHHLCTSLICAANFIIIYLTFI